MTSKTALQHSAAGYDAASLDRPAGERWVTMSNALTRAAHGLTLGEKRHCLGRVHAGQPPSPQAR